MTAKETITAAESHHGTGVPGCTLWGKLGRDGTDWYPLAAHLADTAAAALILWDRWLAPNLRGLFSDLLGEQPREQFALLAGAHDVGKANPLFQLQLGNQRVSGGARVFLDGYRERLVGAGFGLPSDLAVRWVQDSFAGARHEVFTQYLVADLGLPEWAACAVGGHHGRYHPVADDLFGSDRHLAVCAGEWHDQADGLVEALRSALGVTGAIPDLPDRLVPGVVAVTGAVALADWLASDEDAVAAGRATWAARSSDLPGFIEDRRGWFDGHLTDMVGVADTPSGSFRDVFGFDQPNGTQAAVLSSADAEFVVVMAPMGDGKTEAALARHMRLDRALYFGLPTMSTADAMWERVQGFYAGHYQAGELAHSRAILNAFYSDSSVVLPDSVNDRPGGTGLEPVNWFRGRHRALLAPVAVGTCDQVLAAALPHKWIAMRLLGLANKHVVLDEVHTYDAYQDELLLTVLRWMGVCAAPVTLLSATLPEVRVRRYLDAWGEGRTRFAGGCELGEPLGYPAIIAASAPNSATVPGSTIGAALHPIREVRSRSLMVTVTEADMAPAEALAQAARDRWEPGRSIGVICNTVDGSIGTAEQLVADGLPVQVLHSRMTHAHRTEVEEAVRSQFGKGGMGGGIVVGTQVLEASLDIDFDVLVTQLAPMASLLQRSGRLWRHSQFTLTGWEHPARRTGSRPGAPELVVVGPPGGIKRWAALPYTAAELNRTRLEALTLSTWAIPGDLQSLIDRCTITFADLMADPSAAVEMHLAENARRALAAENVQVDWPALADELARLPGVTTRDDIDEAAGTRLVESPTATIVAVGEHGFTKPVPQGPIDTASARELLDYSIPVTNWFVAHVALAATSVDLTDRHPVLRGVHAVHLSDHPDIELHPVFGLRRLRDAS